MLFTPVKIGPLQLRNRSIRAAAFEGMCPGHTVSERLVNYHRSVAAGGVGMTTVAYAAVIKSGLSFPHQLWLRKEIIPELKTLTDAIHQENAASPCRSGIAETCPSTASLVRGRCLHHHGSTCTRHLIHVR